MKTGWTRQGFGAAIVTVMAMLAVPALAAPPTCAPNLDYAGQGHALRSAGQPGAALDAYTCALLADPADYASLQARLESGLDSANYGDAANDANRLKDHFPEAFARMMQDSEQAITSNPADPRPRMMHLLLQWARANDAGVLQEADALLQIDPNNALAYLLRGSSNQYLGDRITPMADFQHALNLGGENPDLYSIIGSTYVQTDSLIDGYLALDRALALDPNDARSLYFRGVAALQDGDYDAALRDLDAAVQASPGYYDACFDLGEAHAHMANYPAAIASYSDAIDYNPSFKLAYIRRGELQEWMGAAEAAQDYLAYVRLNTRNWLPAQPAATNAAVDVRLMPYEAAQLTLTLTAGQQIALSAQSREVDPMLVLLAPDGSSALAGSDDPAPGQLMPAIASFIAPEDGVYTLVLASADPGRADRGEVTVQISAGQMRA